MVSKKQIGKWIDELGIDWNAHGVTKAELIEVALTEEDPRSYLESLVEVDAPSDEVPSESNSEDAPSDEVSPESSTEDPPATQYERQGSDRRPVCPRHGIRCTAGSTRGPITYYYCPEPGCLFSQQLARYDTARILQHQGRQRAAAPRVNPRG